MNITGQEFDSIIQRLKETNHPEAIRVATLRHFCVNLFDHYGKVKGIDLNPLKVTLDDCIEAFLDRSDVTDTGFSKIEGEITRAGETMSYLNSIPN